jgi:glycosyltransferase involved in cell wall biosynthesis
MIISYNTDPGNFNTAVGYGHAGFQIVQSLQRLGHKVPWADPDAPVELFFVQPEYWEFSGGADQLKIGYWPWESTKLHESWYYHTDKADELWTTSYWCKDVFEKELGRPVHVYEHGIEPKWQSTVDRSGSTKLKFLHVGEPAVRKDGQLALNAFLEEFGEQDDVHLTIKAHQANTVRLLNRQGENIGVPGPRQRVTVIIEEYTDEQMVELFHEHDVLVYPSWGEGFGLIPLQGLSTGMPTICTSAWAPYAGFLGDLSLTSRLVDSPWEPWHTGQMYEPDKEHLKQLMRYTYDNWKSVESTFREQAPAVHVRYDWDRLTERAFRHIVQKLG